ncbi:nuclear transport factor 2 family protein [Azorhizobium doebereinerae]|uniref:nuclear transport factor 2 family protein n=1 Tax=Azorhizobium doebereinerae TaxID=281091 RepID=UPI00040AFE3A|nr:nuclear transport factor 2 family protein [Azorhizobium doebereinerae]
MAPIPHDSPLGRTLLAFEAERRQALVSADPAQLERILHPDLVHIHSSGRAQDKAGFMAHVTRMGGFLDITRGELTLHAAGEGGAIISGSTVNRVRRLDTGEVADLVGFGTVVAVHGPLGWQVLLSQITLNT